LLHLCLTVTEERLPHFCLLAGGGWTMAARVGCSVEDLLCGQWGVSREYLADRVGTIFLDGRVLDDPRRAAVADGSTIALSAPMPGIAGAMLRRGSHYAAMRSQISHAGQSAPPAAREGRVVLKLFNLVQGELGPAMLARGVQLPGKALADLFRGRSAAFRNGTLQAEIDHRRVDPATPVRTDWTGRDVFLQVRASTDAST
jgi:hypothetical protein